MGVRVALVTERELRRAVANGSLVERTVLERISRNEWRLLVFLKGHTDGVTLGKYRGGVRTWTKMENILAYVERVMPQYDPEAIDVFLRRLSEPAPGL